MLVRDAPLERRPLAEGYVVRPLSSDDDWEQSRALRREARRRLVDGGNAVFLGAFAGDELAADLGILDCGAGVARYQDVMTGPRTAAAASPRTCSARPPPGRPRGASTPG